MATPTSSEAPSGTSTETHTSSDFADTRTSASTPSMAPPMSLISESSTPSTGARGGETTQSTDGGGGSAGALSEGENNFKNEKNEKIKKIEIIGNQM